MDQEIQLIFDVLNVSSDARSICDVTRVLRRDPINVRKIICAILSEPSEYYELGEHATWDYDAWSEMPTIEAITQILLSR